MNASQTLSELRAPWGLVDMGPESEEERTFGPLSLRMRRVQDEIWLRGSREGRIASDVIEPDDEWMRWSLHPTDRLTLAPGLPDRPVVVSPELPFFLPPRHEARVYVRVPLFVRVVLEDSSGTQTAIADLPSLVLSDTWFGTFTEGVLGYWLTTKARRSVSHDLFEPHLAMCPLNLANLSDEALPVERFAVRVSHLSLFADEDRIWADEVQVRYEASAEGSEVRYTNRMPPDAPHAERIALPREAAPRGLRALTFGVRQLLGFGG